MTLFQQFLLKCEIETNAYIPSEKVIQFINENDLSVEEKAKFYELIISHNMNLYSSRKKEFEILSRVSATQKRSEIQDISFSLDKTECTYNQVNGSDSSDFYFEQIKKFNEDDLENLVKFLPSRNINNCTFILNKLILKLMKEKVFYEQWKRTLIDEDFNEINEEIERIDKIIDIIKEYRDTKKKIIVDNDVCKQNKIIFSRTSYGTNCVLNDLIKIDIEKYDSFRNLIESILNGQFKNVKKYTLPNSIAYFKVRDIKNETRIIFTRFDKDTYVLLGAFVKKTNWSLLENNLLYNAITTYENYLPLLKLGMSEELLKNEKEEYEILERLLVTKDKGSIRR